MDEKLKQKRLFEIDQQIKKAEDDKKSAIFLMIISLFFLWPLLIVGIVIYYNANKKINELNIEKIKIMSDEW